MITCGILVVLLNDFNEALDSKYILAYFDGSFKSEDNSKLYE